MDRRKLVALIVGAAALTAAITVLRSGTAPTETITGPDGQLIRAFHDPQLMIPPHRPEAPPRPPSELRLDRRRDGALLSWPPAPFGFEVRWGRTGGPLDNVSYHATSGTTLRGLGTGQYRVEVRSVDGIGQRSTPLSAEFDVSDLPPEWQRDLGFVADFGIEPVLDAVHWRLSETDRDCLRRDDSANPVLVIDQHCGPLRLRPASPLVLGEPDGRGVRGRVVVITDAPQTHHPDAGLTIMASPSAGSQAMFWQPPGQPGTVEQRDLLPRDAIALRLSAADALSFEVGAGVASAPSLDEYRPPPTGTTSPGALHRWELAFTADRVEARRNGDLVAAARITAPWQQATVQVVAGATMFGDTGRARVRSPARIGLVGLTGPEPDPRPVKIVALEARGTTVHASGATAGRLVASVDGFESEAAVPSSFVMDVEAPPGSPPVPVTVRPVDRHVSTTFTGELPGELLAGELRIALRPPAGELYFVQPTLELTYPAGAGVGVTQPEVTELPAGLPTPSLLVHSPETGSVLSDGERTRPTKHQVELRIEGVAEVGSSEPWLAVQIDLDDRRILTFPTAAGGPAIATHYEFTVDLTGMPDGMHPLVARLVPARPGVAPSTTRLSLRLGG